MLSFRKGEFADKIGFVMFFAEGQEKNNENSEKALSEKESLMTLCTCDTEEGHDGAMGVVSLALHHHHHHQSLAPPLLPRKSSLAGQHHNYHLAPSPQTAILSFKLASAH